MYKYVITILLLALLDISLFYYLSDINQKKKTLNYSIIDDVFLIQTKEIELNSIEEFNFNNYFKLISLIESNYKYEYDDSYVYITINRNINKFSFKYSLIKPEIIEKIVYVNSDNSDNKIQENSNQLYDVFYEESDYFYVDSDYFSFPLETSLDEIRTILSSNINTTYQTSIDYSRLNVSQIGQYSVFYTTEKEIIEIIVEIL